MRVASRARVPAPPSGDTLTNWDTARVPGLDAIGVVVSDIDRAVAFYRTLGLEFPADPDPEGHGHVEAPLPGGLRLMLDAEESVRSFRPDWSAAGGDPRTALAFLCDSPAEVDRVYSELLEAGAESGKEPWDAAWGQRYAMLKDPDGNAVDLFAPLA
jgi:catechol 2,3-dioxygenase-like lactoylglutathione lyase family enzyme